MANYEGLPVAEINRHKKLLRWAEIARENEDEPQARKWESVAAARLAGARGRAEAESAA